MCCVFFCGRLLVLATARFAAVGFLRLTFACCCLRYVFVFCLSVSPSSSPRPHLLSCTGDGCQFGQHCTWTARHASSGSPSAPHTADATAEQTDATAAGDGTPLTYVGGVACTSAWAWGDGWQGCPRWASDAFAGAVRALVLRPLRSSPMPAHAVSEVQLACSDIATIVQVPFVLVCLLCLGFFVRFGFGGALRGRGF